MGPDGIRLNAVLPWFTRTEMSEEVRAFEEKVLAATSLGRLAQPADIARAAAFLALPDSDYITGQLLAVGGGQLASVNHKIYWMALTVC
jgi:NAD(P)-dependent dehydrogenase (short-subunit alcohol dehydrogenase family)